MNGALAEWVADTGQAFASRPASGARVADREWRGTNHGGLAYVEVEDWSRFSVLLVFAKNLTNTLLGTDWNALHEATYLPEAIKINLAEARSDPQASLTWQRLDALRCGVYGTWHKQTKELP